MTRPSTSTGPRWLAAIACCLMLSACSNDHQRPRSVIDFVEDRPALDAKLVTCRADRAKAAEDIECRNARAAANRIAIEDEAARRAALERSSERKLDSIRRQRAASDAQQQVRQQTLAERAEAKIAAGQLINADEAKAIGIDPATSTLVIGNQPSGDARQDVSEQTPPEQSAGPVSSVGEQPTTQRPPPESVPEGPTSLAEIRRSLNATAEEGAEGEAEEGNDE